MNNSIFIMKPKVDFCFKELMSYKEVRLGFCAALLGMQPEDIEETNLLPTIMGKSYDDEKTGVLDVRIILKDTAQIDVEIQIKFFELWRERSLFYWSKMFISQIHEGEDYDTLNKCIHVGILDFELFPENQEYYSRFHLWEDSRRILYSDKIEIHILELPKLSQHEYPQTELLKWARFLNAERREEFEMIAKENEYINKAYERLLHMSEDEKKRMEYEAREKAIRDHDWMMKTSMRRGFEEGKNRGMAQGRAEGMAEGMAQGMTQGSEKAEQRYSRLVKQLIADNRVEMLQRAAEDSEFLHALYEEYDI